MKEKALHASAQLIFTEKNNSALQTAKAILSSLKKKKIPFAKALSALLNPVALIDMIAPVINWKIKKRGYASRSGKIMLEIHSEQEPCAESYITLSDKVDALGMRRIKLNWSIPERSIQTIKKMAKLVQSEFEKAGLGRIVLFPWTDNEPKLTDTYHQAGGLRMADNETEGVVDASCKVFGIDNLYVASSAVFPTSSFSNPTMTAMALSIRVAEIVEQKCKAGSLVKEELFSSAL
jgi:choline dehydrogenase-like flavoprotein